VFSDKVKSSSKGGTFNQFLGSPATIFISSETVLEVKSMYGFTLDLSPFSSE